MNLTCLNIKLNLYIYEDCKLIAYFLFRKQGLFLIIFQRENNITSTKESDFH